MLSYLDSKNRRSVQVKNLEIMDVSLPAIDGYRIISVVWKVESMCEHWNNPYSASGPFLELKAVWGCDA
ncbi:MAG: hypothetical protein ABIR28_12860 [Vicinamibacteria bacterium]